MYEIMEHKKPQIKRRLDDGSNDLCPPTKSAKVKTAKRSLADKVVHSDIKKKKASISPTSSTSHGEECVITAVRRPEVPQTEWSDYRYYPIDAEWQRQKCTQLGLPFVKAFNRQEGRADLVLTRLDLRSIKRISGDGNCLFRVMSFIITSSEDHHFGVRSAMTAHMLSIPELLTGLGADGRENYLEHYNGGYSSLEHYLEQTRMAESGIWGTDFEMSVLAHLLETVVYSYNATGGYWIACFPNSIDHTIPEDVNVKSMYIFFYRESL